MKITNLLESILVTEKLHAKEILAKYVVKKNGKWALISKNTGRVIKYYDGEGKPSEEWVDEQMKRIHSWESGRY